MHVMVNGARLYFGVEGAGLVADGPVMRARPTVILVHGGPGGDHTHDKPAFSALRDLAQLVYYDQRGNGRSDACDSSTWTLDQWGDDVFGLCEALGIGRPIVLGTSFGGFVAQAYATRHPGHAAGLVLISTAARMDFQQVYAAFDRLGGPQVRQVAEDYWQSPTPEGRALYRQHCVPFYQQRGAQADTDWQARMIWRDEPALWFNGPGNEHGRMDFRARLGAVRCPALVLCGQQDPIVPPDLSVDMAAHLPPGLVTLHRFDACGHGVIGDQPARGMACIRDFIGAIAPPPPHRG